MHVLVGAIDLTEQDAGLEQDRRDRRHRSIDEANGVEVRTANALHDCAMCKDVAC